MRTFLGSYANQATINKLQYAQEPDNDVEQMPMPHGFQRNRAGNGNRADNITCHVTAVIITFLCPNPQRTHHSNSHQRNQRTTAQYLIDRFFGE